MSRRRNGFLAWSSTVPFAFVFLALILTLSACGGGGGNGTPSPSGGPDFVINSPRDGSKTAGTMFFSVQPFDVAEVESVRFRVGGVDIGTDTTAEDGFKVFVSARDYPEGGLELSAVATGKNGKTSTRTIRVDNVPDPPSSATVTSEGAVLGTVEENGALSTLVVPAGVNEGARVSFEARTKAEVKADTGVDYDALGVTFLGAQEIDSSEPLQQTLMVASGGFGPQVQPGQAVVNYRIAPDADGDGVGELVVVNTASVAPNGDVISDPVPDLQVATSAKVLKSAGASGRVETQQTADLSAEPGAVLELETTALNLYAPLGNYAFFYSPAANLYAVSAGTVYPHPSDTNRQIFRAAVPNLPAGAAKLVLVNIGSSQASEIIDMTIEPLHALRADSARAVYNSFFDTLKTALADEGLSNQDELLQNLNDAQSNLNSTYDLLEGSGTANAAEVLVVLEQGARMLENTPLDLAASSILQLLQDCDFPIDQAVGFGLALGGVLFPAAGLAFAGASLVYSIARGSGDAIGTGADFASTTVGVAEAIADDAAVKASLSRAGGALGAFSLGYNAVGFGVALGEYADCQAAGPSGGGGGSFTGMGAAPPPGGSAGGSAFSSSGAGSLAVQQESSVAGRFAVKILIGGIARPFTGVTDAGGYFFIPLIPQGQPFVAIATDTQTGEQRTLEGVGPATGDSVYLSFNFLSEDTGSPLTPVELNETVSGELETAGEVDFYSFSASPGQEVFFDIQAFDSGMALIDFVVTDSVGAVVVSTCLGCTNPGRHTLELGGNYTLAIGDAGGTATGSYSFGIYDVIRQTFDLSINETASNGDPGAGAGNIETIGDIDIYTFTASPGQEVFFDIAEFESGMAQLDFVVTDSEGAVIVDTCFGCSNPGRRTLELGGDYAVTIGDRRDPIIGIYSFGIYDVVRQTFDLSVDTTVSNGVPASGAGNIETIGDLDVYTFSASSGQEVFFDVAEFESSMAQLDILVVDSEGTEVVDTCFGCSNPGRRTLELGGDYTVFIGDSRDPIVGTYVFGVYSVTRQSFSIAIGDTVSDGVPAAGAGNIETIGDIDLYTFTASAGQEVVFDLLGVDASMRALDFIVSDSDGAVILDTCLGCGDRTRTLERGGSYTVSVGGSRSAGTGVYSFQIRAGTE